MSKVDLEHLERRLLEERDQTLESIQQAEREEEEGQRESAGDLSRYPNHPADAGSDTQEAEKDMANVNRESEQLALIDTALRVLREDPDAYKTCERCGSEIEAGRLELVPWTRLCAECARKVEAGEGEASA
ncbi:MAG: TraR/DksA C4-type zinc finger protein [Gemmatimonadota bacterium]